ncbi:hybrid sensor histidine kinase/response regulator [Roseateles amylovorans]|uniref:histidine kinase n=1 Tax=Roseateles amylovorans TaxID=2978473 RepID=A0ABY6AW01_9BURK|nr:hybrid sensor histidine kinase/response regulator [Roseateles amylovorans]UXH77351.1 response regulator [Roseateles amylovorans]
MAKDPYRYFRVEARDLLRQMSDAVLAADQVLAPELPARLLRLAHTLKGAASVVRQPAIAAQAHAIEDLLTPLRDSAQAPTRDELDALLALIDAATQAVASLDPVAGAVAGTSSPSTAAGADLVTARSTGAGGPAVPTRGMAASPSRTADPSTSLSTDPSTPSVGSPPPGGTVPPGPTASPSTATDDAMAPLSTPYLEIPQLVPEEVDAVSAAIAQTQAHLAGLQRATGLLRTLRGSLPLSPEDLASRLARIEDQIERGTRQLGHGIVQLRDSAEQLRLLPASHLFGPLQRAARDAARSQGKQLQFKAQGGQVKLEGALLNAVLGALVQAIRNAIAHGIETPERRLAAGKPAHGLIELAIDRRGRQVLFSCTDDGAGLDFAAIRHSAGRRGIPGAEQMDDAALTELLLRGGLSTARQVDALAGRGVGMDLVRDTADRLGGRLSLRSRPGQGTTVELLLPLQLAAVKAILVQAGGRWAWIPLEAVEQVLQRPALNGQHLAVGDELLPHVDLADLLFTGAPAMSTRRHQEPRSALVLRCGSQRAALGVDALDGVASVVLRPPPALLPDSPLVTGLTLDADQQPLPVLSPDGLIAAARQARPRPAAAPPRTATILVIDDSLTTRMLEQSILEAAGYRVHMAASAEDGLEAARRARYALILVDVEMPGMNGFEFIERIRGDAALRDIPAVLVSSRNAPEDFARGESAGADGYIVKSEFAQSEFLAQVARLVARSMQADLLSAPRASAAAGAST